MMGYGNDGVMGGLGGVQPSESAINPTLYYFSVPTFLARTSISGFVTTSKLPVILETPTQVLQRAAVRHFHMGKAGQSCGGWLGSGAASDDYPLAQVEIAALAPRPFMQWGNR